MLWAVAFVVLSWVFMDTSDHLAKSYRLVGLVAYFLFLGGMVWRNLRDKKDHDEYLRLNPPPTERVKAHIKPSTSQ